MVKQRSSKSPLRVRVLSPLNFCFSFMLKNLFNFKHVYITFYFIFFKFKTFFYQNNFKFNDVCKAKFQVNIFNKFNNVFDFLFLYLLSFSYKSSLFSKNLRVFDRLRQTRVNVYSNFFEYNFNTNNSYFFVGIAYELKALRY